MHLEHENVSIFISRNHSVKPHEHDFLELAYVSRGEAELYETIEKIQQGLERMVQQIFDAIHTLA